MKTGAAVTAAPIQAPPEAPMEAGAAVSDPHIEFDQGKIYI